MFAALLVALAAGSGSPAAVMQDPPIRLWINNDRHFERGDRAKVQVETDDDGYVVVLHADPDGRVRVLFPIDPGDDNFLRGGHRYELRGRGNRESFTVDVSSGQGAVYAAYSRDPFRFDDFVQGDHWDYRALNATRLGTDPEPDLTDLVRRMAGGRFDYDILRYDVYYGTSYYSSTYYSPAPLLVRRSYYDPFCEFSWDCDPYYYTGRSGLSVSLIFGRPYRSYYYDPFYYDPFYYDPFYYGGYGYYRPAYRYPGYYPGYYPRSGYQGQIYTPYQFKTINRTWSGTSATLYRDRRDTRFDATHSVYGPGRNAPANGTPSRPDLNGQPRVTPAPPPGRQDAAESRRRRVEDSRPAAEPRRAEPRQSEGQPREVKPAPRDRGNEGRRADPVREGQRERQQGSRRFETVRPQLEPMPDQQSRRDYRAEPEARQYQPPQRVERVERSEPQPRQYEPQRVERVERPQPENRAYQPPPQREQPRSEPRMAPEPQREAPRAQPAPREGGTYSRPAEANRGRFR